MTTNAFRKDVYFSSNATRRIRVEDLKEEFSAEVQNALDLSIVGNPIAMAHSAKAALLKELIDVLEKGVDAPAPDAGISITT